MKIVESAFLVNPGMYTTRAVALMKCIPSWKEVKSDPLLYKRVLETSLNEKKNLKHKYSSNFSYGGRRKFSATFEQFESQ